MTQHASAFTTELFGHYLRFRCLLADKYRKHTHVLPLPGQVHQYRESFYECTDMFITDMLVFSFVSRRHRQYAAYERKITQNTDHTKPVMSCHLDTSQLVELLQQSAVEHLTKFCQLKAQQQCRCIIECVTTEIEALYAYKTSVASISVVCSCLRTTYTRCSFMIKQEYSRFRSLFSWWTTTLLHSLDSCWLWTCQAEKMKNTSWYLRQVCRCIWCLNVRWNYITQRHHWLGHSTMSKSHAGIQFVKYTPLTSCCWN